MGLVIGFDCLGGDARMFDDKEKIAGADVRRIHEEARACGIDLIAFGEIADEEIYLREESREIFLRLGYRWFISMAMRISNSMCDLLQFHEDEGLLWYFQNHCLGQADRLDEASQKIALLIDSWGYGAVVVPGRKKGYTTGMPGIVSHRMLAVTAGMGTVGDSGLLLTERYGPRVRLSSLLTTMPLPMAAVSQKEHCTHCGKCAEMCPSGAIRRRACAPDHPSRREWIDADICGRYRDGRLQRLGTKFCNLCQYVCPVGK